MNEQREFLTFLNGQVMPHSQAALELQRSGAGSAGGFYDGERTFNGRIFKLRKHLERLYNGLKYSGIDPGMTMEEMERITNSIVESNAALLAPGEEFSVTQIVSVVPPNSEGQEPEVNVVIYCQPLDFSTFARGYVDGVRLVTPSTYGAGLSEDGSKTGGPQVFPLMTNQDGVITECKGANFMFAKDGRIKLPDRGNVLPGVSMHTVLELVHSLGLGVDEGEYSPFDVYEADEAFVSSTRYCMLPVASLNGYALGEDIPGPLTSRLLDAWRERVGMDFVQQALDGIK